MLTTRLAVVALLLGVFTLPASAAPSAGPASLLADVVRAINASDAKAFAGTFAANGYAILPAAADEGGGHNAIEAAAKRWLTALAGTKVKLEQPTYGDEVFDGELAGGGGRWRVTGVSCHGGENGDEVKICALHVSEAADDKAVLAAAAAGKLPASPKLPGKDTGTVAPEAIATFQDQLIDNSSSTLGRVNHAVVVGSSAREHAVGRTAVTKLLASWKTLKLTRLDLQTDGEPISMDVVWGVGHVEATFAHGVKVRYRVLVILQQPTAVEADHGTPPSLLAAHFSVALR